MITNRPPTLFAKSADGQGARRLASWGRSTGKGGIIFGHYDGTRQKNAYQMPFATRVTSAVSSADQSISGPARAISCAPAASTFGAFMGGEQSSGVTAATEVTTFAVPITARRVTCDIGSNIGWGTAIGNAPTAAYTLGGFNGTVAVATAHKLTTASASTAAVSGANLSSARYYCWGGITVPGSKGFVIGGYTGSYVATADKVTYSTDTTSATSGANLATASKGWLVQGISDGVNGYLLGGANAGTDRSDADKTTFATDTTAANPTSDLPSALSWAGTINSDWGYSMIFGGISAGVYKTAAYIFQYATGVVSAQTSANLPSARACTAIGDCGR
jgi:hypothetical protein